MRYLPDLLAQAKSIDNWMTEVIAAILRWIAGG
jgi:hypothetical protein